MKRLNQAMMLIAFSFVIPTAIAESQTFRFSNGSAEWFSPNTLLTGDSELGARFLVIKGDLTNTSGVEVMESIQCTAQLSIAFENGKSVQIKSEDICSDAGIGAVAAKLGDPTLAAMTPSLIIAPGRSHRIDTSFGGSIMSSLRGPTLPGKYKPYPIKAASLKIMLTAKTAFGDSIDETIFESAIPNPSHSARFDL